MDKFIVSARKYRPQTFDTVIGQSHITTTLKNAIKNNQLAHAFLFCGPRGVGKTTCARILAKTINCENRTAEGEACNVCNSCVSFNEGTSLNIHELDAASNNSVDDIRSLVDQVRFAPQAGKYKVYIIDEVHMLSSSAFNAFLKTLEEPPPYAIFILATTEKHKILPTILSRCQIFDFKRITLHDTVLHLQEICKKEDISADKTSLQLIAQKSEGCLRDALSILDKIVSFTNSEVTYQNTLEHLNILDADYYFKLMDSMQQQDLSGAMLLYDDINQKGFEGDMLLNGFAEFIRNLLVCMDEKSAALLEVVEGFREKYISTAKKISAAYLVSALNILNESEFHYKGARNKRLHVELAIIKLCYLQQAIELTNDAQGVNKKKVVEASKPIAFRNIQPFEITGREANHGSRSSKARLVIETKPEEKNVLTHESESLVHEETVASETIVVNIQPRTNLKIGALDKIRNEVRVNSNLDTGTSSLAKPIQLEELLEAWKEYTDQLKASKNSAWQGFEMADLQVQNTSNFIAVVSSNIDLRFIEQEGLRVSEFLRKKLQNTQLQFLIVMQENKEQKATGTPLTSREQYQKLIEKYPLIKELKEKLRLELDY